MEEHNITLAWWLWGGRILWYQRRRVCRVHRVLRLSRRVNQQNGDKPRNPLNIHNTLLDYNHAHRSPSTFHEWSRSCVRHLQVSLKCFESDIFSSYFKARGTLQTDKAFFQTKPFFPLTSTLNRSHGMQRSALSGCITSGGFVSSSDEHGSVAQQWSHRDLNLQTVSRSSWSAGSWPCPRHICVKMRMLSISMS